MTSEATATLPLRPIVEHQQFLDAGKFMLLRARTGGRPFYYPRIAEPVTGVRDLEWIEASGRGTVHAVTVIGQKPPAPDYNVVLVDLEEGPRMMSSVVGIAPDAVRIGMAVKARIDEVNGAGVVFFEPAGGEAA